MPFRLLLACFVIATFSFFSPSRANADDIFSFQLGGATATYTWELPASPTIPPSDATEFSFVIPNLTYSVNGVVTTLFPNHFDFLTTSDGGGFALINTLDPSFGLHVAVDEFGPQLFEGSTSAPTFLPGTYMLTSAKNGPGTLTITSVPEPSDLLLIASGLLTLLCLGFVRLGKRSSSV
jgi:hypothetical protein